LITNIVICSMFQVSFCIAFLILKVHSVDRIVPILHAHHYFHLIEDHGMGALELESMENVENKNLIPRPPSLLGFFREECREDFVSMGFLNAERDLPGRSSLFLGWYDVSAQYERTWWVKEFDIDLAAHLDVKECVELLFIPPGYNIFKNSPNIYKEWPSVPDSTIERWYLPKTSGSNKRKWSSMWMAWFRNILKIQVAILNTTPRPINAIVEKPGGGTEKSTINPGELVSFSSSAFRTITVDGNKWVIPYFEKSSPLLVVGASKKEKRFYNPTQASRRDKVLQGRDQFTSFTEASNVFIPPIIPRMTDSGFLLIDMPKLLHRKLLQFWEDYKHRKSIESFTDSYTIINWFHSDPKMVSLGLNARKKNDIATNEVKELVAMWARVPVDDLVLTSFYGMREYHAGNYLRNHVDRSSTHVLSVILQIDQIGVNASWPVEVIDLQGKRRRISMQPGQILFYESAKIIHGRPEVLVGEGFINAFCHYKPKEGWKYHSKNDAVWFGDEFLADAKLNRLRENLFRNRPSHHGSSFWSS